MHAMTIRGGLLGLALAAALGMGGGALAETMSFKASLNAGSEVPPNDSKGTGDAEVSYDTASKMLTWTINFSGLTGPATAAHFHGPAEAGKNAGVAVPISEKDKPFASPFKGSATLTDAQAADLEKGMWYVNVHTEANKGGEIRGQVVKA